MVVNCSLNIHPSTVEPEIGSSPTSVHVETHRIITRSQTGTAIRPLDGDTVLKGGDVVGLRLCFYMP